MKAVIDKYATEPFVWGLSDCCTFAAECWRAVNGGDPFVVEPFSDLRTEIVAPRNP